IADNQTWGFYDADTAHLNTDLHHNGWSSNGTGSSYPSGLAIGPTDVSGDPKFVAYDLAGDGLVVDDLHLRDTSPMLDAGAAAIDPDGSLEDLGAYGGPDAAADWDVWLRDGDGDGLPDGWESEVGLDP